MGDRDVDICRDAAACRLEGIADVLCHVKGYVPALVLACRHLRQLRASCGSRRTRGKECSRSHGARCRGQRVTAIRRRIRVDGRRRGNPRACVRVVCCTPIVALEQIYLFWGNVSTELNRDRAALLRISASVSAGIGQRDRVVEHVAVEVEALRVGEVGVGDAGGVFGPSGVMKRPREEA